MNENGKKEIFSKEGQNFMQHCSKVQSFKFVMFLSNLSTTSTLETPKKWSLYRDFGGFLKKKCIKISWARLMLTVIERWSEVVVNTGSTLSLVKLWLQSNQYMIRTFYLSVICSQTS
jgi:hypothetical protein